MNWATTVPATERWKALAEKFGVEGLAGFIAGGVGLGVVTFRGVMRLLTITSDRVGLPTENGAIAGEVTVEGTLFLVLAGAMVGLVLALIVGLVRESVPGQSWLGLLVLTPLLARLLIIHPDNIDFIRFGPAWVAIVGFTLGVALYLALLGVLINRFEGNWRLPRPLLIGGGIVAAGFLLLALVSSGSNLSGLIGIAVVGVLVAGRLIQSSWQFPLARLLFWAATALGLVTWIQATVEIL